MKVAPFAAIGVSLLAIAAWAAAQNQSVIVRPADVKWVDMKEMPGWQEAVMVGDPEKKGPYVERVKIPPNALIPPHSHPDTENITVLTGALGIGLGPKVEKSNGQVLGAGSFYLLPANTVHYAWAGPKGALIQIHGVGPSGLTMVEPEKK